MSQRRRTAGFTLIEVMVVIVIIGLLSAIIIPNLLESAERAKLEKAKMDVRQIYGAAMSFKLKKGHWPETIHELIAGRPPEILGLKSAPKDPWGRPYRILPGEESYEWAVICDGPDGAEGGDDDISSDSQDGD